MNLPRPFSLVIVTALLTAVACSPVLDRRLMDEGSREVSFAALREHPDQFQGKIFLMGGVIVRSEFSEAGLLIDAVHVPVGRLGEFEDSGRSEGRFLVMLPKDAALPPRGEYTKGRRMTVAAEFQGTRNGKIDNREYVYPLFRVRQFYLWPWVMRYNPPLAFYDPWFYPYPYDYRHPWWYDPQRNAPSPVQPSATPPEQLAPGGEEEHAGGQDRK